MQTKSYTFVVFAAFVHNRPTAVFTWKQNEQRQQGMYADIGQLIIYRLVQIADKIVFLPCKI
jgi:hypothetical protein